MILAEHGATVIRVENHSRLELLRVAGPFKDGIPGIDRSAHFASVNANKYDISLNLNHAKGLEVAEKLVKWADVVAESMSPGKMAKWGLDYAGARRIKPDIVYFSSSLQGQYGPYARQSGYGPQAAALAGLYEVTGWPDGPANFIYCAYTDFISPYYLVTTICAALARRKKTGKGIYIDQSQIEAGVMHLGPAILDYTVNERITPRMGNRDLYAAPHGCYRCLGEDKHCVISVRSEEEWKSFCEVIEKPGLAKDPAFSTLKDRKENEDKLDIVVEQWTMRYAPEEVMLNMQKAGVAAGAVQSPKELFEDPQMKHRKHFHRLEHPVIGQMPYHGQSFKLSKTPEQVTKNAPCLGEDNEYVYKNILGYSDDDISDMLAEGVITVDTGEPVSTLF
jgi:crotonobetainyl-CoA:carnitine CoA-transferase CaiB-like acyl-CoA transferase